MPPERQQFQAPTGTRDVLPPESARWEAVVEAFGASARRAGYGMVLTPLFEDVGVFARGVGEHTDVVSKEMYDFSDKGGRHLALRPEVTASVARAFVQHRPTTPWKVWYWGPQFRYERPQAGRYRQFFQLGLEALGSADPYLDVEVIAVAWDFCAGLGLGRLRLCLNSLGDATCRPQYRQDLLAYLESVEGELCEEHRARWRESPLRVLDCKRGACLVATEDAPRQLDQLCEPCAEHWRLVTGGLESLGIPAVVTPRLVRGLDYYTRTTFELAAEALDSAQDAVGGGGRYDGLVEALGGPPTPATGFSMGLDRLLLALSAEQGGDGAQRRASEGGAAPDAFVVDLVGGAEALSLTRELRAAGLSADRGFDERSVRAQLRAADRAGATVAVIVGPEELASGSATVRLLADARQERVDRSEVVERVGAAARSARLATASREPR
ncbi:MAG: histidine--tRNA ligase [Acidimicrobiales bacterium]